MMETQEQLTLNRLLRNRNNSRELATQKKIITLYKSTLPKIDKELNLYVKKVTDNESKDMIMFILLYLGIVKIVNEMYKQLSSLIISDLISTIKDNYYSILSMGIDSFGELGETSINDLMYNRTTGLSVSSELEMNRVKLLSDIRSQLNTFNETGYQTATIDDIIYNRKASMLSGDVSKAVRLHRTEATRIRSLAKLDAVSRLISLGYTTKRTWLYTWESVRPRLNHVESDGLEENNQGYFEIGGILTKGPGLFGIPSEDINCRCDTRILISR